VAGEFAAYVKQSFQQAKARYQAAPNQAEAAWPSGRACFGLAELATNKTQRAALAEEGISACRQGSARQSDSAAAYYYLGMSSTTPAPTATWACFTAMRRRFSVWGAAAKHGNTCDKP